MKKTLILTLLFLLSLSSASIAQWTGGGEQETVTTQKSSMIDDVNFFRLGLAMPAGEFGENNSTTSGGAKTGLILEFGGIRYFDWDVNTTEFAIGYNYPLTFSYNNWEDDSFSTLGIEDIKYRPYIFIGFGLGPLMSYSPSGDLVFDAYFNLKPTISGALGLKGEVAGSDFDFYSNAAFHLGTSYGINMRYGNLMLGLNFMPSEFTYEMTGELDGDEIDEVSSEVDVETSTTNITIGILF